MRARTANWHPSDIVRQHEIDLAPSADVTVTIPAALRRSIAGAIYGAAANLDVRAARLRSEHRRRAELVAEAAKLRALAEEIE